MTSRSSKKFPKAEILSLCRNENGMATGIVMILTVTLMMIAMAILALNSENNVRDIRYTQLNSALAIIHSNLYAFGQNERAWNATVDFNKLQGRMACIDRVAPGLPCVHSAVENAVLRYPTNATTGTRYFDSGHHVDENHDGFNLKGEVCDFDDDEEGKGYTKIDNGCILRIGVQWKPFCTSDCYVGPDRMIFMLTYAMPDRDQNDRPIGSSGYFLPSKLTGQYSPIPIYNPFR